MSPLIPLYAQIDESTLEAMASKGIVRRARADAYREYRRYCDDDDGGDEGDAALPHPETSTMRRTSP